MTEVLDLEDWAVKMERRGYLVILDFDPLVVCCGQGFYKGDWERARKEYEREGIYKLKFGLKEEGWKGDIYQESILGVFEEPEVGYVILKHQPGKMFMHGLSLGREIIGVIEDYAKATGIELCQLDEENRGILGECSRDYLELNLDLWWYDKEKREEVMKRTLKKMLKKG